MNREQMIERSIAEAADHLSDPQQPLASRWLYVLSGVLPEQLAPLARAWPAIPADRRQKVARTLFEMSEASFEFDFHTVFRLLLADPDAEVRRFAVEGLWEDEDPRLIRRFLMLLAEDPATGVREAAAGALGRFMLLAELEEISADHGPPIAQALLRAFHDPDEEPTVRRRALEAVAYWGEEPARLAIQEAYNSARQEMRQSAVFAMGRSADPYWRGTVLLELSNPAAAMRYEAAVASGELELRQAVPRLAELVLDSDREVQQAAVWALGQIGGRRARRVLLAVAEQDDPVLAEAAGEALEELELTEGLLPDPILFGAPDVPAD